MRVKKWPALMAPGFRGSITCRQHTGLERPLFTAFHQPEAAARGGWKRPSL